MLTRIRRRLSYANVIATTALFMALGGVGYAAAAKNSVTSTSIKNGQVKNADLASNAVTSTKIKNGQVGNADLASNAVSSAKIAANAVSTAKIADGTIGAADLSTALTTDLNDAATLGGQSGAGLQAGATDVRQATGSRNITGSSPAADATTVTLPLPAGSWLVRYRAHALAGATAFDEHMSVSYAPMVGATNLGGEGVTLNTEFSILIGTVGSKTWERTALITTTAPKTLTLVTSAFANSGNWTAGGRSLTVQNASIIAERVGTADGATVIP